MTDTIVRDAVRALLVDPARRVLLMRMLVPDSGKLIWLAPGGGIEPGEDPQNALCREVREETGLHLGPTELDGPVWRRSHSFDLRGVRYEQHERYFLARVDPFEPAIDRNPALDEADLIDLARWWTLDEIDASDAIFVPLALGRHLRDLIAGDRVPAMPVEVGV